MAKDEAKEFEVDRLVAELQEGVVDMKCHGGPLSTVLSSYLVQWTLPLSENTIDCTMEPKEHILGDELIPLFQKAVKHHPSRWYYLLDEDATWNNKQKAGWHEYPLETAQQIEQNLHGSIVLKSGGKFSYEIDPITMTQRNTTTNKVRPIRRLIMLADQAALTIAQSWNVSTY